MGVQAIKRRPDQRQVALRSLLSEVIIVVSHFFFFFGVTVIRVISRIAPSTFYDDCICKYVFSYKYVYISFSNTVFLRYDIFKGCLYYVCIQVHI